MASTWKKHVTRQVLAGCDLDDAVVLQVTVINVDSNQLRYIEFYHVASGLLHEPTLQMGKLAHERWHHSRLLCM